MTAIWILIVHILGIVISAFALYVTIDLQRRYPLDKTRYFIIATVSLIILNITHFIQNFFTVNQYSIARNVWIITATTTIAIYLSNIYAFLTLRKEQTEVKLIIYNTIFMMFLVSFIAKPEWVDVGYTEDNGWRTDIHNDQAWLLFSLVSTIIVLYEVIWPLIQSLSRADDISKKYLTGLIISIMFAVFSNALIYFNPILHIPEVVRFVIADIGFFSFYYILLKHPFIDFYNLSFLEEMIVVTGIEETSDMKTISHIDIQVSKSKSRQSIQQLNKFKDIMHPIRLSILKVLIHDTFKLRTEFLKELNLSSGKFEYHLQMLIKFDLVNSQVEFIDEMPRTIIRINPEGVNFYKELCDVLDQFILI